jgi:hypothetical protein
VERLSLPQSGDYHKPLHPVTLKGEAALAYAAKSIPIFPCKPSGKEPLTSHGHLDATTDPEKIRRWWSRWPDANVAYPTGKRSGVIALDNDTYKPNAWTPEDIERELGELPETTVVETGRGGLQFLYAYPEDANDLRNGIPENKLGPGICVKSDGGYALCPPSVTEGTYRVLQKHPLAPAPKWLVEALRKPSEHAQGNAGTVSRIKVDATLEGPRMPEGERNPTLYKIACSLRARGYDQGELLEALEGANRERCSSPLDRGELEKIAKSASRHTPGNASPEVSEEVIAAVGEIEDDIMRRDWSGVGGKSDRDTMVALTWLARMHGTQIPTGVRISVGVRTLALMAGVSKRSLMDNNRGGERRPGVISRLKKAGLVRSDNGVRQHGEAGAFVLLTTPDPAQQCTTRTTGALISAGLTVGAQLRGPLTAPRLRWSRPVFDGATRVGTISRLGKTKGAIVDHLEDAGGTLTVEDLAGAVGLSRVRDLRRRHLAPLEAAAVVECSGDVVSLTAEWLLALNERRNQDGEIADHRRDMARYQRERDAYRGRKEFPPTPHLANCWADGYVEDLERLPDPPSVEDIYPLIDSSVQTRRGPGRLWQVFTGRIGVVLDSDPSVVTFMDLTELVLEVAAA